jgi:endoglucanase
MKPIALATALLFATPACGQAGAIRVNGVGYAPAAPKSAILETAATAPVEWRVEDAGGAVLLRGRSVPYGADRASGRSLHRIDFGALQRPARDLRLVAGEASSPRFAIAANLYRPLARDALAYFYHNRAGVPIEARYAGGARWARLAGHPREVAGCVAGKDGRGNAWDDCGYTLDVTGGWYDAGDHGKYVVNGGIATWTLLNLYEWQRTRRRFAFADGTLSIPEAGNRVDDLLDEARREVDFLLRMQVPEGRRMKLPVGQPAPAAGLRFSLVETGGMAHHKVADARWTGLPMRPDADTERRVLHPPSTAATLNLAAVAAQCARIWRTIDAAFADRCATAAIRAWAAAERNPAVFATSDFPGSGGYGDRELADERFWAAAELYATTRERRFLDIVLASPFASQTAGEPGWPSVATLGLVTLALSDTQPTAAARRAIVAAADGWTRERERTGFAIPFATEKFGWGSNSNLLNRAMLIALAHDWTGEPRYRAAVVDSADYLLGRNPIGRSYVSGYGTDPMRNPHHRFWAVFFDPAYPPPPPGVLSGGPNSGGGDEVANAIKGKCAPMACWRDDGRAFALNEVAINWNAPLAWVAAWLDATER